ncbi:AMP-binding protein [Nocardia jiangxiensis]|uniref:AMP-binding protein n=1 Tax=Nocardia jiangxiensis TaxID=282685 RepID=A0ABW6RZ27_9NOCA
MGEIRTLAKFLEDGARRWPDRPWCTAPDGEATRAQIYADALRCVGGLRALGVQRGDRIVVVLPNSLEFVRAWFGVILTGAVCVAVNPTAAAAELPAVIAETGASVAIVSPGAPAPAGVRAVTVAELAAAEPEEAADGPADRVAGYIQSSGSTGRPKFIIETHGIYTLTAEGYPFWLGLTESDVLLTSLPLSHLNAQAYSTLGSYGCGARLVLLAKFSASTFWETTRQTGATVFNAIGAMLEILAERPPSPAEREHRIRACYSAPAPDADSHQRIEQRFGFRLVVGYGLSESPYGLICPIDGPRVFGSMGRPRQHPRLGEINKARIVNPDTGIDVADDEVGELLLSNPALTPGYYRMPEETASVLREGWLHTGDLARRDADGNYFFAGRLKEIIRRRGENLSPADVEVVLNAHPAVSSSAVIGVPSPLSEQDVKAFVLVTPGATVDADQLQQWWIQRLPPYKRPRFLEFVDRWPLTATQKIAKKLLPADRTVNEIDFESPRAQKVSVAPEHDTTEPEEDTEPNKEHTMQDVNFAGLNHLALVTTDMDKTVRFYRDVLGMNLVGTTGNRDEGYPYRHYFLSIARGASIAFFEWPEVEMPGRKDSGIPASGIQFDHVSIGVETDEDLENIRKRLEADGRDVSDVVDHGLVRSVYATDPNGISIEFSVSARDLDADPWFDDAKPVAAVLEQQGN